MAESKQQQLSLLGELRQLRALIEETGVSLRSQRDILKTRGMNLPPMAMQSLAALEKDMARLEDSVISEQTELSQLRALADTSAMISSSLDLDNVFQQAMDVVINLTNAERGYIILRNPKTHELEFRVIRESELTPQQGGSEPQISHTILREVVETGEPLLADNAYKDERLQGGASVANLALRSVLCVPLNYKDSVIGVVYVDNRLRSGVFEEREKNLLSAFANQASVAIENARLYEEIQASLIEIGEIKELMDNVFASIGSGVITTDAKHRTMTMNRAASLILECDPEQTIGQKLGALIPGVSADFDNYLAKVRAQDTSQVLEAELETQQRGRIAVSMKLSPLKDAAQITQGVAMVLDDLTDQREREELLSVMRRYLPPEMVDNIHTIAQIDLGGERREVTCMFVDVLPVAVFPENARPQQIMEQVNIYLSRATDSIHRYKGVIDKYMGTEIMGMFNTQLNPMEDHALRAVESALAIRDVCLELYAELGIDPNPHYYRIGIHSGVATLGNVGSLNRREFSAIGDTINLAKRLEENTVLGQIIISEDTRHLLETHYGDQPATIRFEEHDPIQVKGRQQLTKIYEVFRA
jgi:adenylate cyclase